MKRDPLGKRLADCQRAIGYWFADPDLLETALTHSSLRSPDRACNERLEFLGDSVLGLVVTEELFHLLPEHSEGELTRIKSAVVSRPALLATSMRLGLADHADFARGVGRRDRLPPSVVANLVEAVIGAIYLDAGYDAAREFVLRHLGETLERELGDEGVKNHKSLLQHEIQQAINVTPTYRTVEEEGPDHRKSFVVAVLFAGREWGRAPGMTKKEAEQEAARRALEAWRSESGRSVATPDVADAEPEIDEAVVAEAIAAEVIDESLDRPTPRNEPIEASAPDESPEAPAPRRRRRGRGARGANEASTDREPASEPPVAAPIADVAAPRFPGAEPAIDEEPVSASGVEDTFERLLAIQRTRQPRRRGEHRPTPERAKALVTEDPEMARLREAPPQPARTPPPPRVERPPAPIAPPAPAKEPVEDEFAVGLFDESASKRPSALRPERPAAPPPVPPRVRPPSPPAPPPPPPADDDFSAGID